MPEEYDYHLSRTNRFEKRRKNKKLLIIFSISAAVILLLFFTVQLITGDPAEEQSAQNDQQPVQDSEQTEQANQSDIDGLEDKDNADKEQSDEESTIRNDEAEANSNSNVKLEKVETDDELVVNAYTGDWSPIPTEQSGPHEISWEQESQDWEEMMEAATLATGVTQEDMSYLWVSGDGPQKVVATFSNKAESEHYRVYLSWIENEGWQPQRVDELKENDQRHRFNSDESSEEESTEE
ncbi:DUF1510 family protein [Paraliobacillus salinarum]|uniref:DUF1510 family protein n=1 Tax=Paraliobacillus salinarum TaxID=1158996 RepID=UPI0015F64199|nr:DUF1510 family protein [Paraliobacillus salinarum]